MKGGDGKAPDDKPAEPEALDRSNASDPDPDAGKRLVDVLAGGDGTPFRWPSANAAREKSVRPDLARVVETVFVRDIHAEWKDLEAGLELGEKRSDHAHAVAALDKTAARAYRAHRLYLTARAAREDWELENEVIHGAMWSAATRDLQQEKVQGLRSKQVTDADVKARVATMFPDEYQAQEKRRRDLELTVKSLERLAEIWFNRCRDLQAMVGRLR